MRYRVTHLTRFRYAGDVALAHNQVHLSPRDMPGRQQVHHHQVAVDPQPGVWAPRLDYFGNATTVFAVDTPHRVMTVTAVTELDVFPPALPEARYAESPAWEEVRGRSRPGTTDPAALDWRGVRPFAAASSWVQPHPEMTAYAAESFTPGRPLLVAAAELCRRVYADFDYNPGATQVDTPALEAFRQRAGVCQDFTHMMLAMLCGLGLPARYVSGYVRTVPQDPALRGDDAGGITTLTGAGASHAWLSVHDGRDSWVDLDPTNNKPADQDHVTTAWGRDYRDVVPVRGVIAGGGRQQVEVEVDVTPLGQAG